MPFKGFPLYQGGSCVALIFADEAPRYLGDPESLPVHPSRAIGAIVKIVDFSPNGHLKNVEKGIPTWEHINGTAASDLVGLYTRAR